MVQTREQELRSRFGMSDLREEYLAKNNGIIIQAAAEFARDLEVGGNDATSYEAGYEPANAILAMAEIFPEVTENEIRRANHWEVV